VTLAPERSLAALTATPGGFAYHASGNVLPKHLAFLNREIVAFLMRQKYTDCKGIIVDFPPQHGKSEFLSKHVPTWYLGTFPDRKIILSSYESSSAQQWGRRSRDLMEEHGEELFGVKVNPNSSSAASWELVGHQGSMNTAGVGGPITGKGAHLFIIDDPVKNSEEANSPIDRAKKWEWWKTTARTRLSPDGQVILIMTRWHEDDLAGQLIKAQNEEGGDKWAVLNFPALAEEDDILGREVGEALWPGRYDKKYLEATKIAMGPFWWAALYQQRPAPLEGALFKIEWLSRRYQKPPQTSVVVQAWDTAFTERQTGDYSACVTLGETEMGWAVLDVWRGRVEYPDLQRMAVQQYEKWKPTRVLIEDKASGQSLVQSLRRSTRLPIVPVKPEGDKVLRANRVTGFLDAGRLELPQSAGWLDDFIDEVITFPNGAHDDQVDAFVYALSHLTSKAMPNIRFLD
jgi:predicted phage terminase large subunit-like protein